MRKILIGLVVYYLILCVLDVLVSEELCRSVHLIFEALLKSGPYVAAIVALGIAIYSNRPVAKPKLKFFIADGTPFLQQYPNGSSQNIMRLYCLNDSDVLADDVVVELVSIGIPSPLNWTHQKPSNGISKCYDERKILPHQKAYLDFVHDDGHFNFRYTSQPILGTQYCNVQPQLNVVEMVYHTKNGVHGKITVDLSIQGANTTLSNLRQDI